MYRNPMYKENIKNYLDVLEWREKKEWKEWKKKVASMSNPDWDLADKSQFSPFPFKNSHVSQSPLPQTSKHPIVLPSDKPTLEQAYEHSTPLSLQSDPEPDASWELDADDNSPLSSKSKEEAAESYTIVDEDNNDVDDKSEVTAAEHKPEATKDQFSFPLYDERLLPLQVAKHLTVTTVDQTFPELESDSERDVYWGPNSDDNSLLFSQIISPSKEEKSQGTPATIVDDGINHSGDKSQTKPADTQPGATSENTPQNEKKRSYPRDESSLEAISYSSKKLKAGDRLPLANCFLGNSIRRKNSHKNQPLPGKENKPHKSPNISSTHNFFGCGGNQPLSLGSVKKPIKEEQGQTHDKAPRRRNK